jgi:hypothetical protein
MSATVPDDVPEPKGVALGPEHAQGIEELGVALARLLAEDWRAAQAAKVARAEAALASPFDLGDGPDEAA